MLEKETRMKVSRLTIPCLIAGALFVGPLLTTFAGEKGKEKKVDVKVGVDAPSFIAHDDEGNIFKSSDVVGKKTIVLFFFPAALTGG